MNWLLIGLPLAAFYLIWFGYLLFKKQYSKALLFYALAHIPYLLVNLVAPFRGIFDANYAGYSMGWIQLPAGFLVPIIIGSMVVSCFILATRALQNKMQNLWGLGLAVDVLLTIFLAFPVLVDVLSNISAFTVELGEYLKVSGVWVALIIFILFTGPTFYALYYAASNVFSHIRKSSRAVS